MFLGWLKTLSDFLLDQLRLTQGKAGGGCD